MHVGARLVVGVVACVIGVRPHRALAQLEGRITIADGINGGQRGASADAVFSRSPIWGQALATRGPCSLHDKPELEGLSAGTITIDGTTRTITLEETRGARGVRYWQGERVPPPAFREHALIHVEASGGSQVPAFRASVEAPPQLAGYSAPKVLSRDGYTATWTPNPGTEIQILVTAVDPRRNDRGAVLVCRVPDTGAFTIPASTLELIPPIFDEAVVIVGRVARSVPFVGDGTVEIDVMSMVGSGPFPFTHTVHSESREPGGQQLGFAYGIGGVSRNGVAAPTRAWSFRFGLGQRLGARLHLVEELDLSTAVDVAKPPDIEEQQAAFGAGIEWTPELPIAQSPVPHPPVLGPGRRIDLRTFAVTAIVGAASRDRSTRIADTEWKQETAWSPMMSLGLGLLEVRGADWSLGPEFREQLAYFDGHLQRGWMLLLAIRLY